LLVTRDRKPDCRTHPGWAISVLQEAGAIRECEEHGWTQDRDDPHARDHTIDTAQKDPPLDLSPDARRGGGPGNSGFLSATPARSARRSKGSFSRFANSFSSWITAPLRPENRCTDTQYRPRTLPDDRVPKDGCGAVAPADQGST
jgi:hypothetical protein